MNIKTWMLAVALAISTIAHAATNDLTGLLQQGLFEEEANRNLDAAIANYQSLASAFDKDRQLAATAIFRLGECYRKLGKTNDAVVQYQRIVKEFSDQQMLVTLSRQNLAGLDHAAQSTTVQQNAPNSEQLRELALVKKLQAMSLPEILQTAPTVLTDASLINLVYQYNQTELDLVRLRTDHGEEHAEVKKEQAIQAALKEKIYERLAGMSKALTLELGTAANAQENSAFGGGSSGSSESATTDEEQTEIRNIQAMIQNSPDLINAPNTANGGETPLQIAATKGQVIVAKYLLDHGADVDKRAQNGGADPGGSPLLLAAQYGHKTMVELLLAHGADVNGAHGPSPLNAAISRGFTAVVDVLLANKADANAWGSNNGKVLHTAASKGDANFIQLLIAHGADVNATDSNSNTPLHLAVHENKPDAVRVLLSSKANLEARNKAGNTPLHEATGSFSSEIVSLLLRSGATVDATNNQDATPLLLAAGSGRVEAVRVLLAAKADPNHIVRAYNPPVPPIYPTIWNGPFNDVLKLLLDSGANPEGVPLPQAGPLCYAIDKHNLEAVQLLLEHGANPNHPNSIGLLPLKQALTDEKNKPLVSLLLEKGADPNAVDSDGFPPLFRTSDPDLVRLLIDHKADVNARGRNGDTALMRAMGDNAVNLIKILAEAGAKTDLQDTNGNTALHFAVFNLKPEIVAALLEQRVDPNPQNNQGYTPLDLAKGGSNRRLMLGADPQSQFGFAGAAMGSLNIFRPTEVEQKIIDLLVNAGGLANLPKRDRIEVRRASKSIYTIYKDSHNWNHYSLFEVIGTSYGILSQNSDASRGSLSSLQLRRDIAFPDFKKIVIYRRTEKTAKQTAINIDLEDILNSGDCSRDVWLEWGDIVEIPEADHPVNQTWDGLSQQPLASLIKCLTRQVTVQINGASSTLKLDPSTGRSLLLSFMLRVVLDNSQLIRVSSDLSRAKITRQDPLTKKTLVWTVDATDANQANFWLRDGDVIEVPEK